MTIHQAVHVASASASLTLVEVETHYRMVLTM